MRPVWVVLVTLSVASISYAESDTVNGTFRELFDVKAVKATCRYNTYDCADYLRQCAKLYAKSVNLHANLDGAEKTIKIIEDTEQRLNVQDEKSLEKTCRKNSDDCGMLVYHYLDFLSAYVDKFGSIENQNGMKKMLKDDWGTFFSVWR
jgi:hypothetical protein